MSKDYAIAGNTVYVKARDGELFKLSVDDLDLVRFNWRINKCGYPERSGWSQEGTHFKKRSGNTPLKGKGKLFQLHKVVAERMGIRWVKPQIDHIDRDRLNAQRDNLRPATHAENAFNTSVHSTNKLGILGIFENKEAGRQQKYIVVCRGRRKRVYTLQEALNQRKSWEDEELKKWL